MPGSAAEGQARLIRTIRDRPRQAADFSYDYQDLLFTPVPEK